MNQDDAIKIEATVNAPLEKVWDFYSNPEHIVKWNQPSEDWHTTKAENDLRAGGKFLSRMEAKDGSAGFDFAGIYDEVELNNFFRYKMEDSRRVEVKMVEENGQTKVTVIFDPETENDPEYQKAGWQAILDSFKNYVESQPE